MSPPFRVLFICTANACRSQMAEAVLRQLGQERFVPRSAGIDPLGKIHPLALAAMTEAQVPIKGQYSKSFEDLLKYEFDIIITVCDSVACLAPPAWKGNPVMAHWSLPDPVLFPGTPQEQLGVAKEVLEKLRDWIKQLIEIPLEKLAPEQIKTMLYRIAET